MKHVIAIVLLCITTQLSAAERCSMSRNNRDEIARVVSVRPIAPARRADTPRPYKVRPSAAWQRILLFEQQIL